MFASLMRIDVPGGNDPINTRAPFMPSNDRIEIETRADVDEPGG